MAARTEIVGALTRRVEREHGVPGSVLVAMRNALKPYVGSSWVAEEAAWMALRIALETGQLTVRTKAPTEGAARSPGSA